MGIGGVTARLLLFLGADGSVTGWRRLDETGAVEEGEGIPDSLAGAVAVAPAEAVALHWLDLPDGLAPAQAAAAARLLLAERSAQPIGEMHVAVGAREAGDLLCVALAPSAQMTEWLARLAAEGIDPDAIIPAPLLLPVPEEGELVRCGESWRGRAEAFGAEFELGMLIAGGRPVREVGIEALAVEAPLDLRQGPFARRRERLGLAQRRRMALLAAAILLVMLVAQIAAIARYAFAADAAEAETRRVAAAALPGASGLGEPLADLRARLADLRGPGAGFLPSAAAAYAVVQQVPNAELSALAFAPDGTLRLSVSADSPAAVAAVAARLEESGFSVASGALRSGGGRQIADLNARPR
jgi:general secretion pathway protein L